MKPISQTRQNLVLTEAGRVRISMPTRFLLAGELSEVLRGRAVGPAARFTIGFADVVPKLIAFRLILPALQLPLLYGWCVAKVIQRSSFPNSASTK